jgi:hypothetical protein
LTRSRASRLRSKLGFHSPDVVEILEEVTSSAVVHDSFGSLAPQARELHRIIRTPLAEYSKDVLADLREAAGSSEPIPAKDSLDPCGVLHSE